MSEIAKLQPGQVFEQKRLAFKAALQPLVGNPQEQFFLEQEVRKQWLSADFENLFPSFSSRERQIVEESYVLVLSILAYIEWTPDAGFFLKHFLANPSLSDRFLPFDEKTNLRFLYPFHTSFYEKQMMFKACEIETRENMAVVSYHPFRPWPFLEKEEVGQGSFSTVWKATVAAGYYSASAGQTNTSPTVVAYKRFRKAKDYRKELANFAYLRESMSEHKHVCLHLAAIIKGVEFYVFLRWTPYGDLETLLNGGRDRRDETRTHEFQRYDFHAEFGHPHKTEYIKQLASIASALAHLHDKLVLATTQESFYCAHLDLKPRNILVYPDPDKLDSQKGGVGKWMISDFGVSSFKTDESASDGDDTRMPQRLDWLTVGDIATEFSQRPDEINFASSGPMEDREGSFVAPELHQMSTLPRTDIRKCDIWSLGCIAIEVLAFMIGLMSAKNVFGAAQEVRIFRQRRWSNASSDAFFEHKTLNHKSVPHLRPPVISWMQEKIDVHRREKRLESKWLNAFITLVHDTLTIHPAKRLRATEIVERLDKIRQIMPQEDNDEEEDQTITRKTTITEIWNRGYDEVENSADPRATFKWNEETKITPSQTPQLLGPSFVHADTEKTSWQTQPRNGAHTKNAKSDTPTSSSAVSGVTSSSLSFESFARSNSTTSINIREFALPAVANKRGISALSSLGDTAAWIVHGQDKAHKPSVYVFDLSVGSEGDPQLMKVALPIELKEGTWSSASMELLIASKFVTVTALTKNGNRKGVLFDATLNDSAAILHPSTPLPRDVKHIIPSSSGIFAIWTGDSWDEIRLWNSKGQTVLESWRTIGRPGFSILECAFDSLGRTFYVWGRARETQLSSKHTVSYAIYSYDLTQFPDFTEPLAHSFDRPMMTGDRRRLLPFEQFPVCLYTQGLEHSLLWAGAGLGLGLPEGTAPDATPNTVPLSKHVPGLRSNHVQIACGTDWFASIRRRKLHYELYETAFEVASVSVSRRSGGGGGGGGANSIGSGGSGGSGSISSNSHHHHYHQFRLLRDRKIKQLSGSAPWLAVSSAENMQHITLLSTSGKVQQITIRWPPPLST